MPANKLAMFPCNSSEFDLQVLYALGRRSDQTIQYVWQLRESSIASTGRAQRFPIVSGLLLPVTLLFEPAHYMCMLHHTCTLFMVFSMLTNSMRHAHFLRSVRLSTRQRRQLPAQPHLAAEVYLLLADRSEFRCILWHDFFAHCRLGGLYAATF